MQYVLRAPWFVCIDSKVVIFLLTPIDCRPSTMSTEPVEHIYRARPVA